jgi:addiction module HigA family antidote
MKICPIFIPDDNAGRVCPGSSRRDSAGRVSIADGISQYRLARDISVHPRRINEIVQGKRSISADTALSLSRYFGLSEHFWLNLQARYDIEVEKDRLEGRLENEVKVLAANPMAHVRAG